MNQEYYNYALKLKNAGDRIQEITDSIKSINPNEKYNLIELKEVHLSLFNAIDSYEKCKMDLLNINPPDNVKQEHTLLISALQVFTDGTSIMVKAVDLSLSAINKDLYEKGIVIQRQGVELTVKTTKEIGDKLIGN